MRMLHEANAEGRQARSVWFLEFSVTHLNDRQQPTRTLFKQVQHARKGFLGSLVIPRDYFTSTERLLAFQNIVSFILGSLSIGYFHTSLTTRVAFWKPVGQDRAERIWISLLTGTRNAKRDAMHIKWLDL